MRRRHETTTEKPGTLTGNLLSFYFGALLFLATFAAGNNFDYRLVFVLFAFPQLFQWIEAVERHGLRGLASLTLGMILLLLWIGAVSQPLNTADEVASWTVAGLFLALLARTIPKLSTIMECFDFRMRSAQWGTGGD
jgi:hypothetical protein